jgi:hypothetical protein
MMSSKSLIPQLLSDTSGSPRMSASKESSNGSVRLSSHGPFDIFCGRGVGFFDHPGNQRMLSIVQRYKTQYQAASKPEKYSITQHIVQIIQNTGDLPAKFLKQTGSDTDATWYELGDKEVHKKIAHTLRENKTTIKSCKESVQVRAHKRKKREADCTSNDLPQAHAPKLGKDLNSTLTNPVQPTLFYCTKMMMSSKSLVPNLLLDTSGSLRISPSKESSYDSGLLSSHGSLDIFCGRGIGFFDHPGNQRMLRIVQQYEAQYQAASKSEKTSITQYVVRIIRNTGDLPAKFLKQIGTDTDTTWCELGDEEIHKKIAHALKENKTTILAHGYTYV